MKDFDQKEQEMKKNTEINTFPVSFSIGKSKDSTDTGINTNSKSLKEEIIMKAFKFHSQGNISEAVKYYEHFVRQNFVDAQVFSNYGTILKGLGKLKEAEIITRKAIKTKPDFAEAYSNLGAILKELGQLQEAEYSYRKAIEIKSNFSNAHFNLGKILKELGKLQKAELSYRKAIEINPDFANAYNNLGIVLKDLRKLKEAEMSTRKAIKLRPDVAIFYYNLGNILIGLNNLKEAEHSYRKAIENKPDLSDAHLQLGIILKDDGKLKEAELFYKRAISLKADTNSYFEYASFLFKSGSLEEAKINLIKATSFNDNQIKNYLLSAAKSGIDYVNNQSINLLKLDYLGKSKGLNNKSFDRIISYRTVENELLSYLYTLKNKQLEITQDARYGNGVCSNNFELFNDNSKLISILAKDITLICKEELDKEEIIICDSFFNIFTSGSGAKPHNHIQQQDLNFNLSQHKYSLVYYLDIGDQKGEDPGILKLYEPEEEILPINGMIVIIEGKKNHSVSYFGNKDRVMIGVNFYAF